MNKLISPARIAILSAFFVILLFIYCSTLYKLQILDGKDYFEQSVSSSTETVLVPASRGDILDRNGTTLVTNRTTYNVTVNRSHLLDSDDPNGALLKLVYAAIENGVTYNDSFPVTRMPTFEYIIGMTESQQSRLESYFEYFDLDPNMSATDFIVWLKDHYEIDYTISLADARYIIGIRYELELRAIMNIPAYIFAEDVDVDFISVVLEQNIAGISVETSSERVYCTDYASHILGYTGLMNEEEYEEYSKLGYAMNARVGKDGVEQAFEKYLHGTDGSAKITTTNSNTITNVFTSQEAVSGKNVYLTIDIGLQAAAENALADTIAELNSSRKKNEEKADGGAIVVQAVDTGEMLALASYPSFDLSKFPENYNELSDDETLPLFNRATLGVYNPGSTFKMVTSYAGLCSGKITRWTPIRDRGIYTAYEDYQPTCWVYPGNHGTLDVVGALANSCNYFYYTLGDMIGIDAIASAAKEFGLGSKTGIEISETSGAVASPEYKMEILDEDWWAADTLLAAIGQSHNQFTPIQLAAYVSSIANGGTLYKSTLLRSISSSDYSVMEKYNTPTIRNIIDNKDGYINILQEGMRSVVSSGTASSYFNGYKVRVAAKTGTVQSDTSSVNNGVFVCYAPYDDPEIAISVIVENGSSGSSIISAAKKVLDYYFSESTETKLTGDFSLIP